MRLRLGGFCLFALAAAGCGGGASVGSAPALISGGSSGGSSTGSTAPTSAASAGATARASTVPGTSATTAPPSGASPVATSASAAPTAQATLVPGSLPAPSTPAYAAGHANVVPTQPAAGQSRPGQIYSIYITVPKTGDTMAFTVFEPSTLTAGQTYPLVVYGPGFASTRPTTLGSPAPSSTAGANAGSDIAQFVDDGYGVIAFDQRGFGESTGDIRVMDPDYDGPGLVSILDWAQNELPWLAFGPTLEGDDTHEPVVGTIGTSYGSMFQYLLLNLDKRHRVRAIAASAGPYDLNFSLFPDTVPKTEWNALLFGAGTGAIGSNTHANFSPFVNQTLVGDIAAGQEDAFATDFFGYHSSDYFYDGRSFATNGGAGTSPLLPPTSSVPKVNALLGIGVRDGLFDFNNVYHNALGIATGGGDVRLISSQAGHNSLQEAPPDPGVALYFPANDDQDDRCGNGPNLDAAQLMWMNQYLKGMSGAAAGIPAQPCISLSAGDGVLTPAVSTSASGPSQTSFDIGSVTLASGTNVDVPTVAQLFTASTMTVYAGIPHIHLTVAPTAGVGVGTPVVFVGLGQLHASNSATWDLIDNQILPLAGRRHVRSRSHRRRRSAAAGRQAGAARLRPARSIRGDGLGQRGLADGRAAHDHRQRVRPVPRTRRIDLTGSIVTR